MLHRASEADSCEAELIVTSQEGLRSTELLNIKGKGSLFWTTHHTMKTHGKLKLYFHTFVISALYGGLWSASCPCHFTPGGRAPGIYCIGRRVNPAAGLGAVTKGKYPLPGIESWSSSP